MKYTISSKNGTEYKYITKQDFMNKVSQLLFNAWLNGATQINVEITSDAEKENEQWQNTQ